MRPRPAAMRGNRLLLRPQPTFRQHAKQSELGLKAVGDPREVVSDPEARYFGGRVEEHSLVSLGEARLGRIGLDEWLRRSQARA